jgi:hypothetical protein
MYIYKISLTQGLKVFGEQRRNYRIRYVNDEITRFDGTGLYNLLKAQSTEILFLWYGFS